MSAAAIGIADTASAQQPAPSPAPARPPAAKPATPGATAAPAGKPATPGAPATKPGAPQAQAPAAAAAAAPPPPETPPLVYSPWVKLCDKGKEAGANQVCVTTKEGRLDSGQPVVAVALIEPDGIPRKLLRVTVPSGVALAYGARVVVDANEALSANYFVCVANGCVADFEATADMVGKMKKGQVLAVQAVNMAGTVFNFPLPLTDSTAGFTKINEGAPTDPKVFEEQQKKLQAELQKKAEEARRQLESQGAVAPVPGK